METKGRYHGTKTTLNLKARVMQLFTEKFFTLSHANNRIKTQMHGVLKMHSNDFPKPVCFLSPREN